MDPVIETEGLTKQWGSLTAVDNINLRIPAGACYAFLGLNGAGKSTTARMLLDFIRPRRARSKCWVDTGATRRCEPGWATSPVI